MRYIEVSVETTAQAREALVGLFLDRGAGGTWEEIPRKSWPVTEAADPPPLYEPEPRLMAYFPLQTPGDLEDLQGWLEGVLAHLGECGIDAGRPVLSYQVVEDTDWAAAWKTHYHPQKISNRFVVVPTWEEYQPNPGELILRLDPGMAFGTGYHPTTRVALALLEEQLEKAPTDLVVSDWGTGSGILAIAAAKLGAVVWALDHDPASIEASGENARQNQVQINLQQVDLLSARGESEVLGMPGPQLLVANMVTEILLPLLPLMARSLTEGGRIILSGIIGHRLPEVLEALPSVGLRVIQETAQEEWKGLLLEKEEDHASLFAP